MKFIIVWLLTMILVAGLSYWVGRREPELYMKPKTYKVIAFVGALGLLLFACYKVSIGGYDVSWYFGLWIYLFILSIYDLKFRELPDCWHIVLLLFYGIAWLGGWQPIALVESLITAFVVGSLSALVFLIRRDAIGLGDIKLLLVCSLYMGTFVGGMVIRGMFAAFVCSLGLLLFKKVTPKSGLPFVPFLLFGALWI